MRFESRIGLRFSVTFLADQEAQYKEKRVLANPNCITQPLPQMD